MNDIPSFVSQGVGPVLLFLHGIGGNRHSFGWQLPAFADGWRATAWDMPGYGESAPLDEMSFENLAHAVARLLDHLKAPTAALVGHSMGGMVAQEFIVHYPDRVSAVVLSGTSPSFGKPGGDFQEWFLGQRLAPLDRGLSPRDFAGELVPGMMSANPPQKAVDSAMSSMSALSAETYRTALHCLVKFNQRKALGDISCHTLALAGELDEAAPASMMKKMASYIPDCRYHCLMGVGHLANLEDPDAFNSVIREFLGEVA